MERETGRHQARLLCISSLSLAISCNSPCAGQYRQDTVAGLQIETERNRAEDKQGEAPVPGEKERSEG